MGNSQTALQGIHPFRDPEETQPPLPPPPPAQSAPPPLSLVALPPLPPVIPRALIGFNPVVASPEQQQQEQKPYSEFDELFVVKPPTPPPRRVSADLLPPRRRSIKGFFGGRSLRNLRLSRPDLNKLGSLLRWGKKAGKRTPDVVYPVPPDAEKPSPPSRPEVFQEDDYFLLRWDRPGYDGGLPIIGYIIQHLELGLPQMDPELEKDDTQCWYSSEPGHVTSTEVMLNNLIPGTTYIFRIIAENLLGYSQPGDTSTPIVFNPHGELDDWFCPPVFVVVLDERYTVLEHERVCLTVEVTGQPYPLVKFYDGSGVELGRNADPLKYSVTSCGQRRTLTVSSIETSDQGTVRVVAENDKGTVECSTTVVVEAPPRIKRVVRVAGESEEKSEDVSESGVIFQSGELAKFKFVWSASPYPNVCLYHEADLVFGEEVPGSGNHASSQRVGVEIADNWILVKIPNVQRSDRGEWTVRLDNVLGEDSASVVLTVTDKPSRPGRPDVLQLSDNTVILKWSEPVDAGGFPIHAYTVEYFRSEWGVWLKACTVKSPFTKIRDLIPGSKYKFRVKAENLYGVGEASDESVELLITDLVSTLRSVGGGEDATLLMKTVVEEEEDVEATTTSQQQRSTRLDEEEESGMPPTPPKRKLDPRGSTSSLKVTSATMTEPTPPEQEATPLLRVSLHPQVVVLDEPEETLQPPELQPRHRRSPSPMTHRSSIIIEESEPNSREKSPAGSSSTPPPSQSSHSLPPVPSPRINKADAHPTISSVKTQLPDPLIDSQPKKLYSRAEIIRSAAAEDLAYFLSLSSGGGGADGGEVVEDEVEIEEDPELLKVKEALMNDELEDEEDDEEEEYEYDFDQLQMEYEEDKKRGMVSRQDSGVSGRSADAGVVSRGQSFEEPEHHPPVRAHSVQAEMRAVDDELINRRESFERAQSEIAQPSSRNTGPPSGSGAPPGSSAGSGLFLHDRFTDYIAMKAANRNQRVGTSLRSLNSSRYSSSEHLQQQQQQQASGGEQFSRDSGRSSMHQETPPSGEPKQGFRVRSFNMEDELEGIERLERSVSKPTFRTTYDIVSPQGGRPLAGFNATWRGVSAPDLGGGGHQQQSGDGGERGEQQHSNEFWGRTRTLEHSRSERFDVVVPDSGLMARGIEMGGFAPGGLDAGDDESVETSLDMSLERDVPRERELGLQRGLWYQQRDSLSEVEQALESVEEGEEEEHGAELVFGEMEGDVSVDQEQIHDSLQRYEDEDHLGVGEDDQCEDQVDMHQPWIEDDKLEGDEFEDGFEYGGRGNDLICGIELDDHAVMVRGLGEHAPGERAYGNEEEQELEEVGVSDVHEEFQQIDLEKPDELMSGEQHWELEEEENLMEDPDDESNLYKLQDRGMKFGETEGDSQFAHDLVDLEEQELVTGAGERHASVEPDALVDELQHINLEERECSSGEVGLEENRSLVEEPDQTKRTCEMEEGEVLGAIGGDLQHAEFVLDQPVDLQELASGDSEGEQHEPVSLEPDEHVDDEEEINLEKPDRLASGGEVRMEVDKPENLVQEPNETKLTYKIEGFGETRGNSQCSDFVLEQPDEVELEVEDERNVVVHMQLGEDLGSGIGNGEVAQLVLDEVEDLDGYTAHQQPPDEAKRETNECLTHQPAKEIMEHLDRYWSGGAEQQGDYGDSVCQVEEQHGLDSVRTEMLEQATPKEGIVESEQPKVGPEVDRDDIAASGPARERRRNLISLGLGGTSGSGSPDQSEHSNIPVTIVRVPPGVVPLGSVEVQHETRVIDLVEGVLDLEILTPKRFDATPTPLNKESPSMKRRTVAPYASEGMLGTEKRPKTNRSRPTSLAELSELSPVTEEQSRSPYAPDMKAYDRISMVRSRRSTRETTPLVDLISKLSTGPATASTAPVALAEIQERLLNIEKPPCSPLPPPPPATTVPPAAAPASSSETKGGGTGAAVDELESPESASGFMRYVCVLAFYVMLSPVVLFVDNMYVALLCLLLVASVHYFFITF